MPDSDGLSVTLKRPETEKFKGNGSWAVFHGSPRSIKQHMGDFFGFDTEGMTPVQVATEAERRWQSEDSTKLKPVKIVKTETGLAAPEIDAEIIEIDVKANREGKSAVETVVDVLGGGVISEEAVKWDDDEPPFVPDAPAKDPVVEAIEKAESKQELQALYVAHTEDFKRPEVLEAAKKRTGEVSA